MINYDAISTPPTPPTITTASLPGGTTGTAYGQTLSATGDSPITWSITSGSLPGGLTLSAPGGIYGTPTTAGTFSFTVRASNSAGNNTKALTIVISATTTLPTITKEYLAKGKVGTEYVEQLTAIGTTPITWTIESGALPAGLSLNGTNGLISGIPTTDEIATFAVKATNTAGSVSKTFTITIGDYTASEAVEASSLQGWMTNGTLFVKGLTVGQPWQIFNLTGMLIYTGIAVDTTADLPLPARGVYIIRSGNSVIKIVN
jgi:hypothetical protein